MTLVTRGNAERATSIETFEIRGAGGPRRVSPALYTSLEADPSEARQAEVAATRDAVAAVQGRMPDVHVAAVAYVRGTADSETAEAWRTARQRLGDELAAAGETAVPALPGQGWDFMTADKQNTFWLATPITSRISRRRSETQAAANVGSARFVIRTFDA